MDEVSLSYKDGVKIKDKVITEDKIADSAITASKIATGAITLDKLSPELRALLKIK